MVARMFFVAFVFALVVAFIARLAYAHEMAEGINYPAICCDNRDCRHLEPDEIEWTPEGYHIIPWGEVVPFDVLPYGGLTSSPDGYFHACEAWNYAEGIGRGKLRWLLYDGERRPCFWAPEAGG